MIGEWVGVVLGSVTVRDQTPVATAKRNYFRSVHTLDTGCGDAALSRLVWCSRLAWEWRLGKDGSLHNHVPDITHRTTLLVDAAAPECA